MKYEFLFVFHLQAYRSQHISSLRVKLKEATVHEASDEISLECTLTMWHRTNTVQFVHASIYKDHSLPPKPKTSCTTLSCKHNIYKTITRCIRQKNNLVARHLKTWYSLLALDLFLPAGLCNHVWLLCSQFSHLSTTLTNLSQSQLILFFILSRTIIIIIHNYFNIRQISR